MSLTNIFNEPRREIMETLVGLGVLGLMVGVDYGIVQWLGDAYPFVSDPLLARMFIVGTLMFATVLALLAVVVLVHAIGSVVCAILEKRGVQMRPRQRRVP